MELFIYYIAFTKNDRFFLDYFLSLSKDQGLDKHI